MQEATEIRILTPAQERLARAMARQHALDVRFRPLEEFLPGEGTGSIVAIAHGRAAAAWLQTF
ncbi:hypothetical protein E0493_12615 [Roseomonas sp. M0104]|uniref:Uncharacterized protein n=1 Tax=Teichococcus coralli TaxID=2545983 RepID=A0A845BDJ2_9PROT|nr:hypothetical protein [Pseudoroseomonas coralli]MXP64186.1 hypothetical protein [Pseudoroseomonas coralli]